MFFGHDLPPHAVRLELDALDSSKWVRSNFKRRAMSWAGWIGLLLFRGHSIINWSIGGRQMDCLYGRALACLLATLAPPASFRAEYSLATGVESQVRLEYAQSLLA